MENIIEFLKSWDDCYYNGDPAVPDNVYDEYKKSAQKEFPDDPYFRQVGSSVRTGKIKLPYPMGSLDQKENEEIINWVTKYNSPSTYNVSAKLDGVSAMLVYQNHKLSIAYSRGNGIEGADITRHVNLLPNVPKTVSESTLVVRGELIMKSKTFESEYSNTYANARNMVAGMFNRKESDKDQLANTDFVSYEIVNFADINPNGTKEQQLLTLTAEKFMTAAWINYGVDDIKESRLEDILKTFRSGSEYELDGVVVTINDYQNVHSQTSAQTLNPEYAIKYKKIDTSSIVTTTVRDVHWAISKNGYLKPRVEVEPVQLFGTTVTFATGYNARFIFDRKIMKGSIITITKGGSVIPKIL